MNKDIYVIAEAALSYHGNKELCNLLVKSAKIGLANAIKFQIMYADDICVQPYKYHDLFETMEMPIESWKVIRESAALNGLDFIADVFGPKSFEIAEKLDVDGYKIHTTIFNESHLVRKIILTNKKVFLSVGGLSIDEVLPFCKEFQDFRNNICLLFGYQAEPTSLEKNYLNRIPHLRESTGLDVGFMDHIDASTPYKYALSHVALGLGVTVFEKHIALCREFKFENYISSLTTEEFAFYTQSLKDLHSALGSNEDVLNLSSEEKSYRTKAMKKIVASNDIKIGEKITSDHIMFKRSDESEKAFFRECDVLGKSSIKQIKYGELLNEENICND